MKTGSIIVNFLHDFKICLYRLRSEMENLRRVYGEQTEKAKHEFMHLHSKKVRVFSSNILNKIVSS